MRKIAGLTQVEFAKFVGVAPRIVIDIERGVANPTLSTLRKIGLVFGLDVFFGRKDRP
jgi:DNA-binding XRE family transcriptional regulator